MQLCSGLHACCAKALCQALGLFKQLSLFKEVVCACSTIYNMCTQKPPHDYSEDLYTRYKESFVKYITEMARPHLILWAMGQQPLVACIRRNCDLVHSDPVLQRGMKAAALVFTVTV